MIPTAIDNSQKITHMAGNISNLAWTIPSTASKVTDLTRLAKEIPTLSSHQVLVKLTAASLNYRDILVSTRSPLYPSTHKPDLVPGVDGAGTIYSVGASSKWIGKEGISIVVHPNSWLRGDVRNIKSDRIIGGASLDGTLQQYMAVDDECIIEAPKHLAPVENASLITAGTTAWAAIRGSLDEAFNGEVGAWKGSWTDKRLQGKSILILGTGGVSCFAIQVRIYTP
jgi:NADPH:quinone reductase-like Zn-dependent oxidoreductase